VGTRLAISRHRAHHRIMTVQSRAPHRRPLGCYNSDSRSRMRILPMCQVDTFGAGTAWILAHSSSWTHQGAVVVGMRRCYRANRIVTHTTGSLPSDMVHANVPGQLRGTTRFQSRLREQSSRLNRCVAAYNWASPESTIMKRGEGSSLLAPPSAWSKLTPHPVSRACAVR
jgi:hypothetical protein